MHAVREHAIRLKNACQVKENIIASEALLNFVYQLLIPFLSRECNGMIGQENKYRLYFGGLQSFY